MPNRPKKTKTRNGTQRNASTPSAWRRSTKLLILFLLIGPAGAIVLLAGVFRSAQQTDLHKIVVAATEASQDGNHERVVEKLSPHLTEFYEDPGTLKLFAQSRLQLPDAGNQHLADCIRIYRRILELTPDDLDSKNQLMMIYERVGNQEQSVKLARELWEKSPDDIRLATRLAKGLLGLGETRESESVCRKAIEKHPAQMELQAMLIQCLVNLDANDETIQQHIAEQCSNVPEQLLRLAWAKAQGHSEEIRLIVKTSQSIELSTPEHSVWLVSLLEQNGMQAEAEKLLLQNNSAKLDTFDPDNLLLAYRLYQSGKIPELMKQIETQQTESVTETTRVELLILQTLGYIQLDNMPDARRAAEKLDGSILPLAIAWRPVLESVCQEEIRGRNLLQATQAALKRFPQSAYLVFFQATAYEILDETDLAFTKLRLATNLAPRWVLPRVGLARQHVRQGDFDQALAEISMALQVNPDMVAALDVAFFAVLGKLNSSQTLERKTQAALRLTVDQLKPLARDDYGRAVLQGIELRSQKLWQESDEQVGHFLGKTNSLSIDQLRMLELLAVDASLKQAILERLDRTTGIPFDEWMDRLSRLALEQGIEKALELVEASGFETLTQNIARARLMDQMSDSRAGEAWKSIVAKDPDNSRLIELALSSPAIQGDFELAKQWVVRLKHATMGQGIAWVLADCRLRMKHQPEPKHAAKIALRMESVIKRSPKSAEAYAILADAYLLLDQEEKMVETLELAIENEVERPGFRLILAREYLKRNQSQLAVQHAKAAHASRLANSETREAAIRLMRDAGAREMVANALRRDLPKQLSDTDEHFRLASAYVMAMAEVSRTELTENLIRDLARDSDRWFGLWVDAAVMQATPLSCTVDWLEQSRQWLVGADHERRKKISAGWRRIARRENRPLYWENAIDVLKPTLSFNPGQMANAERADFGSYLVMAGMLAETGRHREALEWYSALSGNSNIGKRLRAVAANNQAALICQQKNPSSEQLAIAEKQVQNAIEWESRPEFWLTLADVYRIRDELDLAERALKNGIAEHSKSYPLRIRLVQSSLDRKNLVQANDQLLKMRKLRNSGVEPDLAEWNQIRALEARLNKATERASSQLADPE